MPFPTPTPERPECIREAAVYTNLSTDRSEASVSVVMEIASARELLAMVVTQITLDELPVGMIEDPIRIFPGETHLVQSAVIPRVRLWWPSGMGRRSLYSARVTLADREGNVVDQRLLGFGVRDARLEGEGESAALMLNGAPVPISAWRWDDGVAPCEAARLSPALEFARDTGANLILARGPLTGNPPAMLRQCDQLGLLVFLEPPEVGGGDDPASAIEAAIEPLRAFPSLAAWILPDPPTDNPDDLRSWLAAIDPLRPVLSAEEVRFLIAAAEPSWTDVRSIRAPLEEYAAAQALQVKLERRRRRGQGPGLFPGNLASPDSIPLAVGAAALRAASPFHVAAEPVEEDWVVAGHLAAVVWLHNRGPERALLNVVTIVSDASGRILHQENNAAEAPADASEAVGDCRVRIPDGLTAAVLSLEVVDEEGETLARTAYLLGFASEAVGAMVRWGRTTAGVKLRNDGAGLAVGLTVQNAAGRLLGSVDVLPPGAECVVRLSHEEVPHTVKCANSRVEPLSDEETLQDV